MFTQMIQAWDFSNLFVTYDMDLCETPSREAERHDLL